MSNLVTVRDNHLTCKGVHVVQYGDTQEQLMSLLQQGYQLTYYLENPPEEGKLTLSKPNDDSITGGCVNPCGHLELRLTLSSDQIPADLTDYYNVLYPPDFNGPRGTADVYSADVRAFMQNILTAYTTLLREYELNPPETTPDITVTTDTTVTQSPADNIYADPGLCGPQPQINIDPEYAKQLEEQFKNVKIRQAGYGRGQAFFKFIYDSDEAITPSGYELVRTESWSGPDCTDEQIADIARYIIQNDFYGEQQKALMQEAVDAFLAKEEKITVADGTPNYTPVSTFSQITVPDEKDVKTAYTTVTDTTNNVTAQNADPVPFGPQPQMIFDPENVKFRQAGYGRGQAFFRFIYDSDEAITPSGYELVRTESWSGPDCTDEQIADIARYIIQNDFYGEQQKALMLEAVDAFLANPKKAQSIFDLTFTSTMDAETAAVTSVQVACAEDGGWRTIGTLNPGGIDWKYQAGNLTGSGTASVVWQAQELGALGVWTDGTDNWTAIDGWFDENWTMLGCGDFDGDGKDSVLMSLYGGLFYSVDLDGTLSSLGDLNWSGWEFGAVGDFAGDGRDDVVLLHRESGTVVLLADGNADSFERLGQLASDWSVAGAGDFDADGKDDLLVRQNSTGIAGAYASADMSKWSTVSSDYYIA